MIKVFVYGNLGKLVGSEWDLDISTPAEAFRAIEANTGKLYKYLSEKESEGLKYSIFVDKVGLGSREEMGIDMEGKKELHIIPEIEGAGSFTGSGGDMSEGDYYRLGAGLFVGGGAFKWMSAQDWGVWDFEFLGMPMGDWGRGLFELGGEIMMEVGLSVALQGVIKSLQSDSDHPDVADKPSPEQTNSFIFENPTNNVVQGAIVPVGYGRLRVGSHVVSSAILNCRLNNINDIDIDEPTRDLINDQDIAQHINMIPGREF